MNIVILILVFLMYLTQGAVFINWYRVKQTKDYKGMVIILLFWIVLVPFLMIRDAIKNHKN